MNAQLNRNDNLDSVLQQLYASHGRLAADELGEEDLRLVTGGSMVKNLKSYEKSNLSNDNEVVKTAASNY